MVLMEDTNELDVVIRKPGAIMTLSYTPVPWHAAYPHTGHFAASASAALARENISDREPVASIVARAWRTVRAASWSACSPGYTFTHTVNSSAFTPVVSGGFSSTASAGTLAGEDFFGFARR